MVVRLVAFFLAATAISSPSLAQDVAQPIPTKHQCSVPVDPSWREGEKYVWVQVCLGEEANLLIRYGGDPDPTHAEYWPAQRTLTSRFLETILLNEKYRRALTRVGVRITGARFEERVDLENAEIRHELWLLRSRLHHGADFSGLRSTRLLLLQGSAVSDELDRDEDNPKENLKLDGAEIGGNLYLDGGARLKNVGLSNAIVHGDLALGESNFAGTFTADGLSADSISTEGKTEFAKAVSLAHVHVKGDLTFNRGTTFRQHVDLTRGKIDGDLNLNGIFSASVDLTGVKVDGNLDLSNGAFSDSVDLTAAKIGGNIGFNGGQFHGLVNLAGVQITGDFGLGPKDNKARWLDSASLNLWNAKADRIPSICGGWPAKANFDGFVYRAIGPIPPNNKCPEGGENALAAWLDKLASPPSRASQAAPPDTPESQLRSTQPYEQLATVLQAQGDVTNATEVRYRARDKERQQSGFWRGAVLLIAKYFVGYGYYFEWAFIPVVLLLIAGIVIMRASDETVRLQLPWWGAAYTLDMLLPLIRLRDSHYTITLTGWAQTYFYFHKIMGYVLASVLIAAAAGLGK
jgi:hypothetical protein